MLLAFVADVHLGQHRKFGRETKGGLNERCRLALDVFDAALLRAVKLQCRALVVCGDLFDTSKPSPPLLAAVQERVRNAQALVAQPALPGILGAQAFEVIVLAGNHDKHSEDDGDHALAPLWEQVKVITQPELILLRGWAGDECELLCLPYQTGKGKEWFPAHLGDLGAEDREDEVPFGSPTRVVAVHLGISDSLTPVYLQGADDSISEDNVVDAASENLVQFVLAGNWHHRERWHEGSGGDPDDTTPDILQVGALVPTGWDNEGLDGYGGLALLDTTAQKLTEEVLPGPRFVRVEDSAHILKEVKKAKKKGHKLYLRAVVDDTQVKGAAELIESLVEKGDLQGGEALLDPAVATFNAKQAANAAKDGSNLRQATAGFVKEMPLPDGVDRAAVLGRVLTYLKPEEEKAHSTLTALHLRSLVIENFMGLHPRSAVELDFPEEGIVLVTGKVGAGKSSLIEAVSYALWGKTLRGTTVGLGTGSLKLKSSAVGLDRSWIGGTKSSTKYLTLHGRKPFETLQKAQEYLGTLVGLWEVWRRTSVFSSSDAAHFSLATDGERKRLLEDVLGLGRFDSALESCRFDKKAKDGQVNDSRYLLGAVNLTVASAEEHAASWKDALSKLPPATDSAATQKALARAQALRRTARRDLEAVITRGETAAARRGGALSNRKAAQAGVDRLAGGECRSCGQAISAECLAGAHRAVQEAEVSTEAALREAEEEMATAKALREELQEEHDALMNQERGLHEKLKKTDDMKAARENLQDKVKDALESYKEAKALSQVRKGELTTRERELGELEAAERALGLRGVRANVLGGALSGMTSTANAWLGRLSGGKLVLSVEDTSVNKDGSTRETLALDVTGAGGGSGYRGASGGERRQIDVSLLLALGEVAASAAGQTVGTLFFDEVFDALDAEGRERVADVLAELSVGRAVIVITHRAELAELLRPVLRLHVEAGEVSVRTGG